MTAPDNRPLVIRADEWGLIAAAVDAGQCKVLWQDGDEIASLRKMPVSPTQYEVKFQNHSAWSVVNPDREFVVIWPPAAVPPTATAGEPVRWENLTAGEQEALTDILDNKAVKTSLFWSLYYKGLVRNSEGYFCVTRQGALMFAEGQKESAVLPTAGSAAGDFPDKLPHPEDIDSPAELVGLYMRVYAGYVKVSRNITSLISGDLDQNKRLGKVANFTEAPLLQWLKTADEYLPDWFNHDLLAYPDDTTQKELVTTKAALASATAAREKAEANAKTLRVINRALYDGLAFYADEDNYQIQTWDYDVKASEVQKDLGETARVILMKTEALADESEGS